MPASSHAFDLLLLNFIGLTIFNNLPPALQVALYAGVTDPSSRSVMIADISAEIAGQY
jgi:hypothetical protein